MFVIVLKLDEYGVKLYYATEEFLCSAFGTPLRFFCMINLNVNIKIRCLHNTRGMFYK